MKTEFISVATVISMVIVLGIQALLQGIWRINDTKPIKVGCNNDNRI